MTTEYFKQRGVIRIPDRFNRGPEFDQILHFEPLGDSWLAANERTWDEINTILKGRINDIRQRLLSNEMSNVSPESLVHYDIRHATLSAFVLLFDEYNRVEGDHDHRAQQYTHDFEFKKEEIKNGKGSIGGKQHRIQQLYKSIYDQPIRSHVRRQREAGKVKQLVLKKAWIDLFSITQNNEEVPIGYQNLPRVLDEVNVFFQQDERFASRNLTFTFLNELARSISTENDSELLQRFQYKSQSKLLSKPEEAVFLNQLLNFSVAPYSLDASVSTRELLHDLGQSFLIFMRNKSQWCNTPENPNILMQFLYDSYSVYLFQGIPQRLTDFTQLVDQFYLDYFQSKIGKSETEGAFRIWCTEIDYLCRMDPRLVNNGNIVSAITSDQFRVIFGSWAIANMMDLDSTGIVKSKVLMQIRKLFVNNQSLNRHAALVVRAEELTTFIPQEYETAQISLDANLYLFLNFIEITQERRDADVDIQGIISQLHADAAQLETRDIRKLEKTVLNMLIYHFISKRDFYSESVDRENNYLWSEVLNNPRWFVSPKKDRFHQNHDEQLKEYRIDWLLFSIDPHHPREHKIEVKFTDLNKPFYFWLDTNKNLLNQNRWSPFIDPRMKGKLTNLLLKRLYVITSGMLSNDEDFAQIGITTRMLEYKRAHYRFLTSTDARIITMQSSSAQLHAREVLEDYGIDIYGEIRRRRLIGTLKADEFLTFVREVRPDTEIDSLPNELGFDISLLSHLPVF